MPAVFHAKDMIEDVVWKAIECGVADIVIDLDAPRLVRVFRSLSKLKGPRLLDQLHKRGARPSHNQQLQKRLGNNLE
jgi:hypothetical protein